MLKAVTPTEARANIYKLIDEANESHQPIHIHGKEKSAILVAEEDWRAIQETLYLSSIPGLKRKIIKGGAMSIEECSEDLPW